jgi:hypothetical protein
VLEDLDVGIEGGVAVGDKTEEVQRAGYKACEFVSIDVGTKKGVIVGSLEYKDVAELARRENMLKLEFKS